MAQAPGYDANKANRVPFAMQRNRAVTDTYEPGLDVQARDDRRRALVRHRHADVRRSGCRTRSTSPTASCTTRSSRHTEIDDRRADPLALVERRRRHDRREAGRAGPDGVDHALRLRHEDRHRLPGREPRAGAAARQVVGLDDRQRADRPGHRRHADPDGGRLRRDRERRRLGPAAPRRAGRRSCHLAREAAPDRVARRRPRAEGDAHERRRRARRDRQRGRDRGLHRRRQDRNRPEARPERLYDRQVRRVVRRDGARRQAAPARAGRRRRAARRHLRRPVVAAPAFAQIAKFDLQYLAVPPDVPPRPTSRGTQEPII